ncbi:COG1361 S-layer family protein [Anoxybacterium hadale]|uniref:COG1361 S-layer family protein n=1 Tax=Anoxybacterium hadale TaxID=3408580 RepID=UPI003AFFA6AF
MNSKKRKATISVIVVAVALMIQAMPLGGLGTGIFVYGDNPFIKSKLAQSASVSQGDENALVAILVENTGKDSVTFSSAELTLSKTKEITISGGTTGTITLSSGESTSISFYVTVGKDADIGDRTMNLKLKNNSELVHENANLGRLSVYELVKRTDEEASSYANIVDITQSIKPEGGFVSGQDNVFTVEVVNYGNSRIKNAEVVLTLPEGLSLNNASSSVSLGYLSYKQRKSAAFPIIVEENAASKNYPITVKLKGQDQSNKDVSIEKTYYIAVSGTGASLRDADIVNINIPSQVSGQDEFVMSFDVVNKSRSAIKDVKIDVEVPEGLLNKTRASFVESSIPAGGSKNYSVTMFADAAAKEKAYTIKISLSSSVSTEKTPTITQYASIYVSVSSDSKTPQLMVDDYSYGGTFVQAGDQFLLNLGLFNTSASHKITNIKVTVSTEDGSIIPVNSSNSFYIDSLGKKERTGHSLLLSVKPGAEQKTTPLTVDMSYEDGAGNALTSKDVISIPVMQETRLEVDDVIAPPELYTGMQSGLSVQFYNMGKTTLNNLRVSAEGNFDTPESTSYFVGNMESGKSDSYDFTFIPREEGAMEGKIIFTYEDAAGDEQVLERPFSFNIMGEMPAWEEETPPEDNGAKGGKLPWIIGAAAVSVLTGGGIFIWKRRKRKKLNREMEIDE